MEFSFSRFVWWVQIIAMMLLILLSTILILPDAIAKNSINIFITYLLFIVIAVFNILFLWFYWPFKVNISEDNIATIYTKGRIIQVPLTSFESVWLGKGIWLFYKNGFLVFGAAPTNSSLWAFIHEISKRNPDFTFTPKNIFKIAGKRKF